MQRESAYLKKPSTTVIDITVKERETKQDFVNVQLLSQRSRVHKRTSRTEDTCGG